MSKNKMILNGKSKHSDKIQRKETPKVTQSQSSLIRQFMTIDLPRTFKFRRTLKQNSTHSVSLMIIIITDYLSFLK